MKNCLSAVKGPLISVIVAVYNVGPFLSQCVDSILSQTVENLEIILVDDGSTDDSARICDGYASVDARVQVIHQGNAGVSVARNNGLKVATGEWIVFVDGDDFLDVGMIETLASVTDDETDIACCAYNSYDGIEAEPHDFFPREFVYNSLEEKLPLFYQLMDSRYGQNPKGPTAIGVPWAKLYRKSSIDANNLQFVVEQRRMQDNIFNMWAFYYARKIKYVNRHLYYYRTEHIHSYGGNGYTPDIYLGVLKEREIFCSMDARFSQGEMLWRRQEEKERYFFLSIKNLASNAEKRKDFAGSAKCLLRDEMYVCIPKKRMEDGWT